MLWDSFRMEVWVCIWAQSEVQRRKVYCWEGSTPQGGRLVRLPRRMLKRSDHKCRITAAFVPTCITCTFHQSLVHLSASKDAATTSVFDTSIFCHYNTSVVHVVKWHPLCVLLLQRLVPLSLTSLSMLVLAHGRHVSWQIYHTMQPIWLITLYNDKQPQFCVYISVHSCSSVHIVCFCFWMVVAYSGDDAGCHSIQHHVYIVRPTLCYQLCHTIWCQ